MTSRHSIPVAPSGEKLLVFHESSIGVTLYFKILSHGTKVDVSSVSRIGDTAPATNTPVTETIQVGCTVKLAIPIGGDLSKKITIIEIVSGSIALEAVSPGPIAVWFSKGRYGLT